MSTVNNILDSIEKSFWDSVKESSSRRSRTLAQMTWYHYKLYKRVDNFNSKLLQTFRTNNGECKEIPNERKLFHISPARFSLINIPVTYLANEHVTSWEEIISQYRYEKDLSFYKHILPYLDGLVDPTPDNILHFIRVNISEDAIILDLANSSSLLIQYFEEHWSQEESFYNSVIYTKNEPVYDLTKAIAEKIHTLGFDGIVYRSVRTEKGARHPDLNLVIFSENKVIRK